MENLPRLIDSFAAATGRTISTVSRLAGGKGDVHARAVEGRLTIRRAEQVVQWLSDHWPASEPWPADIPRPDPAADSPAAQAQDEALRHADPAVIADELGVPLTTVQAVIRDCRRDRPGGRRKAPPPPPAGLSYPSHRRMVFEALLDAEDPRFITADEVAAEKRREAELKDAFDALKEAGQ